MMKNLKINLPLENQMLLLTMVEFTQLPKSCQDVIKAVIRTSNRKV